MERTVQVRDVQEVQTRSGNTRFTLVDEGGNQYTTFRPEIGGKARATKGVRARITYHEEQRGNFHNVYLDAVEAVGDVEEGESADEVAWNTAIEAAPWLAGEPTPDDEVPADELFEKLKPFKELVKKGIEADS